MSTIVPLGNVGALIAAASRFDEDRFSALISHMDTVFRHGDVARLRPHWEGNIYFGPGAGEGT